MPQLPFHRKQVSTLLSRLSEPPNRLILIAGPRQIGKTTMVRDVLTHYGRDQYHFVSDSRQFFRVATFHTRFLIAHPLSSRLN